MTPDLQTQIRSDALTRERAKQLADASKSLTDGFPLWGGWDGLLRRTPVLEIPELHEYLTDAADWDADTWDFEPEGCRRLARTLDWLYAKMPEAFRFSSLWGPERVNEQDIDRAELLAVIERNAVSTTTIYRLRAA